MLCNTATPYCRPQMQSAEYQTSSRLNDPTAYRRQAHLRKVRQHAHELLIDQQHSNKPQPARCRQHAAATVAARRSESLPCCTSATCLKYLWCLTLWITAVNLSTAHQHHIHKHAQPCPAAAAVSSRCTPATQPRRGPAQQHAVAAAAWKCDSLPALQDTCNTALSTTPSTSTLHASMAPMLAPALRCCCNSSSTQTAQQRRSAALSRSSHHSTQLAATCTVT
jgi:hypothetical protein